MVFAELEAHADFEDWQPLARQYLRANIEPDHIHWLEQDVGGLFSQAEPAAVFTLENEPALSAGAPKVSRAFMQTARYAASHNDPQRFDLLYRLLWRLTHGERGLMGDARDLMVSRANQLAKQVGRERHKMTAFVRFRKLQLKDVESGEDLTPRYIAWFEPEHYTLRLASRFFCHRFANMDWSIITPYQSMHWLGRELSFGRGGVRADAPQQDDMEDAWRLYYASIFNPARLKVKAMQSEMPKKYWHNLPEANLIAPLIRSAARRSEAMLAAPQHETGNLPASARFDRQQWLDSKGNS
ncbi:TIGR03915 family putative DNA repair protein [Spongiibacter sp. KMU-158]|uniref:TIGR03915 family putative DNA repair protein n=1 Tax=Spongiibacter pelagi TaxID=2760804 RepID=A0A927BY18_9GAMM|nr:TIGR03915 family putative DNA repair protein [Spongiibacter pelagi]MBD2857653.1 TIGR03915 family putative DNA repair protein [Spongiibacter pelagi]